MSSPEDDYSNVPTPEPLPDIVDLKMVAEFPETESPSEVMREVRASIVSNFLKKGAIGAGVGVALSLGIFKRRVSPIFFSTGFALGMASEEGNQLLRQMNERIRQNAIQLEKNRPKPPPFEKLL